MSLILPSATFHGNGAPYLHGRAGISLLSMNMMLSITREHRAVSSSRTLCPYLCNPAMANLYSTMVSFSSSRDRMSSSSSCEYRDDRLVSVAARGMTATPPSNLEPIPWWEWSHLNELPSRGSRAFSARCPAENCPLVMPGRRRRVQGCS